MSGGSEREVYHDVTTGEWVEVDGGDESYRRMVAARRLDCDESDLRPGYDHSDRAPEDWRDDLDNDSLEVLDEIERSLDTGDEQHE